MKIIFKTGALIALCLGLLACGEQENKDVKEIPPETTATPVESDVVAESNELLQASRLSFKGDVYQVQIHNPCKEEDKNNATCNDIELTVKHLPDGKTQQLLGRSMTRKEQTPSLFGYTGTAPETNQTYIILLNEQELVLIENGAMVLQEAGQLSIM